MTLKTPFIITSRLLAGVKVGTATISIEDRGYTSSGRTRWGYYIDLADREHEGNDMTSGVGGGTLQEGMGSLLSFLGAAAESYNYNGMEGENSDLFPEWVTKWASENSDEISMLQCEIEETPELITD